ncbi:outer membrane protein [Legionella sp. CNM-4043-24]|uniref:outer membrane protein n=1 Tax=Legionella sp. CNM-4043-24 TaxID=3421646 RepID=UPI00403B2FF2
MMKKIQLTALGLGFCAGCFAGDMGIAPDVSGFYLEAMLDYNNYHFDRAYTASFFGPEEIRAPSAQISDRLGYSLGAGYRFNNYIRTAFTFQARPSVRYSVVDNGPERTNGDFDSYAYMMNAYLSHPSLSRENFTPYIMGGLGVAQNKTSNIYWPLAVQTEFSDRTSQFAWQAGIGGLYAFNPHWMIDLNYHFVSLGEVKNSGQYDAIASNGVPANGAPTRFNRVYSNQFELGIIYQFGVAM